MESRPLISLVVLNYNGKDLTQACLKSIFQSDYLNFEVIMVDNYSTDDSVEFINKIFGNDVRMKIVKNQKNLFYAGGNNKGMEYAQGEFIFILNNDTEIHAHCLSELYQYIKKDNIGAVQPKVKSYGTPLLDNVGGIIDRWGYTTGRGSLEQDRGQYDNPCEIFYTAGAAMMVKKKVLEQVGLFDARFAFHWEDVDLSWRIRLAGYKIVYVPEAIVYHKISQTIKKTPYQHRMFFHIRKNRIAGLIKNYSIARLLRVLPGIIVFYFFVFLKEFIVDRNVRKAWTSLAAIFWNIKELPDTLKQRTFIQGKVRVVPEAEIVKFFYHKSIIIKEYIEPFLNSCCAKIKCKGGEGG